MNKNTLLCYNRGCGAKYHPEDNPQELNMDKIMQDKILLDACRHHPGMPFFHDAYKGWSCCNKKCIDFTEFLNIKGCTLSPHSNIKPKEPEKKPTDKSLTDSDLVEVKIISPIKPSTLKRPPFESTLSKMVPVIAPSVKQKFEEVLNKEKIEDCSNTITIGTSCKNGGCKSSYAGVESESEQCIFHPGVPIFHEGLKYWSCCEKRTTDFNVFLNQPGCNLGLHKWTKDKSNVNAVNCRWDWHQTATHVVISIYAKSYDPVNSFVKLNPIRLKSNLVFPDEGGASFDLDIELRGIIDVDESKVEMMGTKVEIKLRKAEPGSWAKVDFPRKPVDEPIQPVINRKDDEEADIDLDDIELVETTYKATITEVE